MKKLYLMIIIGTFLISSLNVEAIFNENSKNDIENKILEKENKLSPKTLIEKFRNDDFTVRDILRF